MSQPISVQDIVFFNLKNDHFMIVGRRLSALCITPAFKRRLKGVFKAFSSLFNGE
jgi:hypothetical protein